MPISPAEAAELLHISPSRLRALSASGHITASHVTPGGHRRYTASDIHEAQLALSGATDLLDGQARELALDELRAAVARIDPLQPLMRRILARRDACASYPDLRHQMYVANREVRDGSRALRIIKGQDGSVHQNLRGRAVSMRPSRPGWQDAATKERMAPILAERAKERRAWSRAASRWDGLTRSGDTSYTPDPSKELPVLDELAAEIDLAKKMPWLAEYHDMVGRAAAMQAELAHLDRLDRVIDDEIRIRSAARRTA